MPNRISKIKEPRQKKLGVGLKQAPTYREVPEDESADRTAEQEKTLILPKTVAGMMTNKRYGEIRKMGLQMGDIAALAQLHEDGKFPGELLFTGTKKQLLSKQFKKARLKMRQKLEARWRVMYKERVDVIAEAQKILKKRRYVKNAAKKAAKKRQRKPAEKPVLKLKKRSVLNEKVKPLKLLPKPTVPTSYTNGDLPEINSPHGDGRR